MSFYHIYSGIEVIYRLIIGDPGVESVESLYNVVSLSIYLDCEGLSTVASFVDVPGFGDPE